ncbi:ATP-binding cassette domain-containing protein [Auraticoccus sp. F435]|uniref:ATP-binding cassette domain-containing protein n=1 Tax=Auraticoccus cholistanensis TaxID=2656650 RepID=A0A6A9UXV3_9ACTN|nr:ABC transporter ATP-binding protein [Auraticoccus cholistanensis]MVA76464.1 ATP-binding cassette domain-containing protein [Auraticoccus cholistanensis]
MTRLLDARNLRAAYRTQDGRLVRAVDDVSVHVDEGEVLGVAGESGCGKSTLGAILSLNVRSPLQVESGTLDIEGKRQDFGASAKIPRTWRGSVVSLLPQGAMNSISPTMRVRDLCFDVVRAHDRRARRSDALDRVRDRIADLGLPPRVLDAYPHQLSGGMKQRVVTVISTLLNPRLLIADEPTSALDVSSQRALIEMLKEMLEQKIMAGVIFVTHDLPVLRTVSDRIAVMYAGKIVEVADAGDLVDRPRHPYSAALLSSVLVPEPRYRTMRVKGIPGAPPNLLDPPPGCRFHPRCGLAMPQCHTDEPPTDGTELRYSACHWSAQHPGESVPVEAATRDELDGGEPLDRAGEPVALAGDGTGVGR